jgi:transposase-like protein
MSTTTTREEHNDDLFYESHYLAERQQCRECGSTNVYTRVYFHEKTHHARWLCRNCAVDYVEKRGYKLLVVPVTV